MRMRSFRINPKNQSVQKAQAQHQEEAQKKSTSLKKEDRDWRSKIYTKRNKWKTNTSLDHTF